MWDPSDHPGVRRLILLIDRANRDPDTSAAMETVIAALEDRFGLSPKGRRSLRWRIGPEVVEVEPLASRTKDERRARVLKLLSEETT
jgi:hypothetical protein